MSTLTASSVLAALERDGIVLLPNFVCGEQLANMTRAFKSRLRNQRWNDVDGYEKTERYRHMVQDVLVLDQGFVDVALHPLVQATLRDYIGPTYELVEAKGWKSLPTRKDFHGWHGDAWYDQTTVRTIPREVKLALYLTDVTSGFFEYIRGSHRKQAPRPVRSEEMEAFAGADIVQAKGTAGTAFLFDTSGIHRQSVPVLEPRLAIFYNYHDPSVPLQTEDVEYYRYHPLILSAAYLGSLDEEDRRVLGFGNKQTYIPAFERQLRHRRLQQAFEKAFNAKLVWENFHGRVRARLKRTFVVGSKR